MKAKQFSLVLQGYIPYVLPYESWPHGLDWLLSEVVIPDGRII